MRVPSILAFVFTIACLPAFAAETAVSTVDLWELLKAVEEGRTRDSEESRQRIQRFQAEQRNREQLLADAKNEHQRLEGVSADKETTFEANELMIGELETRLQERMGSLKELFGVLQQVASDAQAQFHVSLTQLDYPDRNQFLVDFAGRMGQANRLPAIGEIERLWFELQREMTESGRLVQGSYPVVDSSGVEALVPVTRVGVFNAIADGKYLRYVPETGRLLEFSRQPAGRYMQGPRAFAAGQDTTVPFAIDPVRGQLMEILTQAPDLTERVAQGGAIGYTILALGLAGLLLALSRLAILLWRGRAVSRQLREMDQPRSDNPLGRILLAARADDIPDIETLELRMGEAVLRETPRINGYIPLLKIIAAVAPLMGLLGTVTGMIITFQAITLFGAGDPRLMAGGISQALITTVLGLCVAIPMLLLHQIVQMRARALTNVLQHEAVAEVAARVEASHGGDDGPPARQETVPEQGLAA